jgi:hypothetical protein
MTEEPTTQQFGRSFLPMPNPIPEEVLQQLLVTGWFPATTLVVTRQSTSKEIVQGANPVAIKQITIFWRDEDEPGTDEGTDDPEDAHVGCD